MTESEKVAENIAAVNLNNGSLEEDDDIVNPWNVESKSTTGVDYDKLISMCPSSAFHFLYFQF